MLNLSISKSHLFKNNRIRLFLSNLIDKGHSENAVGRLQMAVHRGYGQQLEFKIKEIFIDS